jgi:predicted  nucleic acid-binding Zn-ribbon protein|tara:strand:+ start:3098 stop:3397 length:300 start_codon:yes stop_codon:yes gene_type:complete
MEFIKTKLIALLGLKNLYAEIQELRDNLEYLESQYEDTKYLAEDLESSLTDVSDKTDNLETIIEDYKDELSGDIQLAVDDFNQMKEGYVLDVKLTREVY